MAIDYADIESGFGKEIEEQFLNRMNVIQYDELSPQTVDRLKEEFPDEYAQCVVDYATGIGVTD